VAPNGSAILLRVNLPSASKAREPDVYRDCSNRLLDREPQLGQNERPNAL